jgi:hypothetical protein
LAEVVSDHEAGLHLVHMMFCLFEEEGIWDARIPRAYFDAFQIATASGDEARTKVFAERVYAARTVIEGEHSPETMRLKRLAEHLTEHSLYGISKRWTQFNKEAPQEMGEEEVENWLWTENE